MLHDVPVFLYIPSNFYKNIYYVQGTRTNRVYFNLSTLDESCFCWMGHIVPPEGGNKKILTRIRTEHTIHIQVRVTSITVNYQNYLRDLWRSARCKTCLTFKLNPICYTHYHSNLPLSRRHLMTYRCKQFLYFLKDRNLRSHRSCNTKTVEKATKIGWLSWASFFSLY